jgi:hypothetical protein
MVYYPFTGRMNGRSTVWQPDGLLQQNKIALGGQSLGIYYDDRPL